MVREMQGNIFTTKAQTIVNTVNCVGVMGAGIAFEFRLRYPDMYEKYRRFCQLGQIQTGKLWLYKAPDRLILNFPTKRDWKHSSKIEYLQQGLEKFVSTYRDKQISSIAFPMLGADKGGIAPEVSLELMHRYLSKCGDDIDIEIWRFDPTASDDRYELFRKSMSELDNETLAKETKIRRDIIQKIRDALTDPTINSMSGLLRVRGIGDKTVEKLFRFTEKYTRTPSLFSTIK